VCTPSLYVYAYLRTSRLRQSARLKIPRGENQTECKHHAVLTHANLPCSCIKSCCPHSCFQHCSVTIESGQAGRDKSRKLIYCQLSRRSSCELMLKSDVSQSTHPDLPVTRKGFAIFRSYIRTHKTQNPSELHQLNSASLHVCLNVSVRVAKYGSVCELGQRPSPSLRCARSFQKYYAPLQSLAQES